MKVSYVDNEGVDRQLATCKDEFVSFVKLNKPIITSCLSSSKRDDVDDNDGEGGRVPGLGGT